jgi:rhodanese-related sulfurtransferase
VTALDSRIDSATLEQLVDDNADLRILDVRTPAEFESVHIPGAYNVPLDTLGEHAEEFRRHVSEPVILVCRSGTRASQACDKLAAAGMSNVHILDGGMQSWDDGRRPVRRGRQRWDLERQVRFAAGALVLVGIIGGLFVPGLKYLAGFVGAGLVFAALTNTCTMAMLLSRLPYNRTARCDVDIVVRELVAASRQ